MGYKHEDAVLKKVEADEMLFVLRAQDVSSPKVVLFWMMENFESVPEAKLREAFEAALDMKRFPRRRHAD